MSQDSGPYGATGGSFRQSSRNASRSYGVEEESYRESSHDDRLATDDFVTQAGASLLTTTHAGSYHDTAAGRMQSGVQTSETASANRSTLDEAREGYTTTGEPFTRWSDSHNEATVNTSLATARSSYTPSEINASSSRSTVSTEDTKDRGDVTSREYNFAWDDYYTLDSWSTDSTQRVETTDNGVVRGEATTVYRSFSEYVDPATGLIDDDGVQTTGPTTTTWTSDPGAGSPPPNPVGAEIAPLQYPRQDQDRQRRGGSGGRSNATPVEIKTGTASYEEEQKWDRSFFNPFNLAFGAWGGWATQDRHAELVQQGIEQDRARNATPPLPNELVVPRRGGQSAGQALQQARSRIYSEGRQLAADVAVEAAAGPTAKAGGGIFGFFFRRGDDVNDARKAKRFGGSPKGDVPDAPGITRGNRADFHIQIRDQGFEFHGTTSGGYVQYRHPDGRRIHIRPNGQVLRFGPKVWRSDGAKMFRPRIDADGNRIDSHDPPEFLDALPGS